MRPLRYSINVTLDGCCDHRAGIPDEETHRYSTEIIAGADALLFGRVIYQMMESAFREPGRTGVRPEWTAAREGQAVARCIFGTQPLARSIPRLPFPVLRSAGTRSFLQHAKA